MKWVAEPIVERPKRKPTKRVKNAREAILRKKNDKSNKATHNIKGGSKK